MVSVHPTFPLCLLIAALVGALELNAQERGRSAWESDLDEHIAARSEIAAVLPFEGSAVQVLADIRIPNSDNVRGHVTLPTAHPEHSDVEITWTSSHPAIVSDEVVDGIEAGIVTRPPVGAEAALVTLTACVTVIDDQACRDFELSVQPQVEPAEFTRYGMFNFARSNSHAGQQIYMASSIGNDATRWEAVNNGEFVLESTKGMHAVRDPSIVRSPEGDKFFLIATDLKVDGDAYGWHGWDWAQSGASRYIEVWESDDLRTWSPQRHVLVAPEEAGMTFAPEAIWDKEIQAYVVYWTSSMYPEGTYFTPDSTDTNRRYPITRNQTLYTTTRDFVTFTPWQTMSNRPGHGTLDAVIIEDDDGYYHRFVTDRTSTGVETTKYVPSCESEDIYQERATSILASEEKWELIASCITHDAMGARYAEAPLIVKANPGDERGDGYYLFVDQQWADAPAGDPWEQQLHPYWGDLVSGEWTPIDWVQKPEYNLAEGVIRHGSIIALTQAEHAALHHADLIGIEVTSGPDKTIYERGEALDLTGLVVAADYNDGVRDHKLAPGYGGYSVSGFDPSVVGMQDVVVSYEVVGVVKEAVFEVEVVDPEGP